jgi:hypothetical protein
MQLLLRHTDVVSLWIPNYANTDELWLAPTAGQASITIATVLQLSAGKHIGFCNDHFC